jgi:hypothetical protein
MIYLSGIGLPACPTWHRRIHFDAAYPGALREAICPRCHEIAPHSNAFPETVGPSRVLFTALPHRPWRKCLIDGLKKHVEKRSRRENETGVLQAARATKGESIRAAAQPCRQISGEVAG